MQFTIKGESFESPLTDGQAITICRGLKSNFAQDLVRKSAYRNGLTINQLAWVHKLALDSQKPKVATVEHQLDTHALRALFDKASERLKNPRVTLSLPNGTDIRLYRAGDTASFPGSINVTNGVRYGTPGSIFYGRIHKDGRFEARPAATAEVVAFLQEFASKPAFVAAQYGHRTGFCCFCRIRLTDERSVAVGYGPICADNYGLPWGRDAAEAAEAVRLERMAELDAAR